jgi:hypothetical protein
MLELTVIFNQGTGLILDHRGFEPHIKEHGLLLNGLDNFLPKDGLRRYSFSEGCYLEETVRANDWDEDGDLLQGPRVWAVKENGEHLDLRTTKYLKTYTITLSFPPVILENEQEQAKEIK